jgi:hypothetical protein
VGDFVFWRYSEVKNPNYNFYYDLIFKMFLGLISRKTCLQNLNRALKKINSICPAPGTSKIESNTLANSTFVFP